MARLKVGRVTLRQAARQLEGEGLLSVRRGLRGGYFAVLPTIDTVHHVAALYLGLAGLKLDQFIEAAAVLGDEMVRRAACSRNGIAREELLVLNDELWAAETLTADQAREIETRMMDCYHKLCANPFIELVLRISSEYIRGKQFFSVFNDDLIAMWRKCRLGVNQAILDHDPELAHLLTARFRRKILAWSTEAEAAGGKQSDLLNVGT